MSTCPSKDLHSVYLDNELPEQYKAKYEAHVQSCPKCQKELETLRNLQKMLRTDADEITPDSHYMDQSYERLLIKMKYRENTQQNKKTNYRNTNSIKKPNVILYSCMGAAAAAVFALIVPIRISNAKAKAPSNAVASTTTVLPSVGFGTTATNVGLNSGKTVIISGNIDESVLASDKNGYRATNVSQGRNSGVEVFRPHFEEKDNFYIKITLPGMGTVEDKLQ